MASQGLSTTIEREILIVKTFTHVKAIKPITEKNQDISQSPLSLVSLSAPPLKPVPDCILNIQSVCLNPLGVADVACIFIEKCVGLKIAYLSEII